jgi:hypothetical protein
MKINILRFLAGIVLNLIAYKITFWNIPFDFSTIFILIFLGMCIIGGCLILIGF